MAIFKRSGSSGRPDVTVRPKAGRAESKRSRDVFVIGSTLVIKGELSAAEDLIIEGQVEGTIAHHKKHLTVGEKGRVKGDIHASSVIVLGELVGDVHSDGMVSIAKTANVFGNIYCARLVVEDGARVKGNIVMMAPPEAEVPAEPVQADSADKNKPPATAGRTAKPSVF